MVLPEMRAQDFIAAAQAPPPRETAKGGSVSVCPHCGGKGGHFWAGSGQCPGMQEDKDNLKSLLNRAADALEPLNEIYPQQKRTNLIDELRKAAQ